MFSGAAASHGFLVLHGDGGGEQQQQHAAQTHTNRISASGAQKGEGEFFTLMFPAGGATTSPGFTFFFFLGSGSLDLAEVCVRGDGCGEGDAPPARGGG